MPTGLLNLNLSVRLEYRVVDSPQPDVERRHLEKICLW